MNEQLNDLPCGFLTFTKAGIVLSINHTLLELLEYNEGQVVGKHINVLLAESAKAFTQLYFFPLIIVKKRIEEMYLALTTKKGVEIPVLINASFSQKAEEQVITCVMIPMHNRDAYENQLLLAKKSAEDSFDEMSKMNAKLEKTLKNLEEKKQKLLEVNQQNEVFKVDVQNKLELAKKIQAKSLSRKKVNGDIDIESYYLASGELSGDTYGIYQINEHQYGIIILDVMGKGISSALITMSLQSLFQMMITKGTPPNVVMKELDDHLHTLFQNNQDLWHYSTGICLMIDTNKQTIECTNAGHPPAIFQDATGNQVELCSTSPPLGAFERTKFKVEKVTYDQDSRILLYTDGVSEPLRDHQLGDLLKQDASESLLHCKENILRAIRIEGEEKFKKDDQCFIIIDLK